MPCYVYLIKLGLLINKQFNFQIAPFNYVKKMKHYDPAKWPLSATATANPTQATALTSPQANLMVHIPKMREDHLQFSSELARYVKGRPIISWLPMIIIWSNFQCLLSYPTRFSSLADDKIKHCDCKRYQHFVVFLVNCINYIVQINALNTNRSSQILE